MNLLFKKEHFQKGSIFLFWITLDGAGPKPKFMPTVAAALAARFLSAHVLWITRGAPEIVLKCVYFIFRVENLHWFPSLLLLRKNNQRYGSSTKNLHTQQPLSLKCNCEINTIFVPKFYVGDALGPEINVPLSDLKVHVKKNKLLAKGYKQGSANRTDFTYFVQFFTLILMVWFIFRRNYRMQNYGSLKFW